MPRTNVSDRYHPVSKMRNYKPIRLTFAFVAYSISAMINFHSNDMFAMRLILVFQSEIQEAIC